MMVGGISYRRNVGELERVGEVVGRGELDRVAAEHRGHMVAYRAALRIAERQVDETEEEAGLAAGAASARPVRVGAVEGIVELEQLHLVDHLGS